MIRYEQFDPKNPEHDRVAADVARWSRDSESMKDLSWERMSGFKLSIFGFDEDGSVASHAAITEIDGDTAQIGGYVVGEHARRRGIGRKTLGHLMGRALASFGGFVPESEQRVEVADGLLMDLSPHGEIGGFQAFVNLNGLAQFRAVGGTVVGRREAPDTGCVHVVTLPIGSVIRHLQQPVPVELEARR